MTALKLLIPAVVILVLLIIVFYRVRKQRNLLKQAEEYERLLRDARVSRYQYRQALESTRAAIQELEEIQENLNSLRAELHSYRRDLRQQAAKIREQILASDNSELDKRVVAQMKHSFAELWARADKRKKILRDLRATHRELQSRVKAREQEEQKASQKWTGQKSQVMTRYSQLKSRLTVTDPNTYFG